VAERHRALDVVEHRRQVRPERTDRLVGPVGPERALASRQHRPAADALAEFAVTGSALRLKDGAALPGCAPSHRKTPAVRANVGIPRLDFLYQRRTAEA